MLVPANDNVPAPDTVSPPVPVTAPVSVVVPNAAKMLFVPVKLMGLAKLEGEKALNRIRVSLLDAELSKLMLPVVLFKLRVWLKSSVATAPAEGERKTFGVVDDPNATESSAANVPLLTVIVPLVLRFVASNLPPPFRVIFPLPLIMSDALMDAPVTLKVRGDDPRAILPPNDKLPELLGSVSMIPPPVPLKVNVRFVRAAVPV